MALTPSRLLPALPGAGHRQFVRQTGAMPVAVLAEMYSVVVRVATLVADYAGGAEAYEANCPNATFCSDGECRVGFMSWADAESFLRALQRFNISTWLRSFEKNKGLLEAQRMARVPSNGRNAHGEACRVDSRVLCRSTGLEAGTAKRPDDRGCVAATGASRKQGWGGVVSGSGDRRSAACRAGAHSRSQETVVEILELMPNTQWSRGHAAWPVTLRGAAHLACQALKHQPKSCRDLREGMAAGRCAWSTGGL